MNNIPSIPNFEKLSALLKQFNNSTEEYSVWIINEMTGLEGYDDWLAWMEEHRPNDLP
jgi:hypothetical protein